MVCFVLSLQCICHPRRRGLHGACPILGIYSGDIGVCIQQVPGKIVQCMCLLLVQTKNDHEKFSKTTLS